MPKKMEKEKREELKLRILKALSLNSRASVNDLANYLHIPKPSAYILMNEAINEYGIVFVPEINIENIWRYEFLKLTKVHSKREMFYRTLEQMHEMGFEEYIVMIKFIGRVPGNEEFMKATKSSYMLQFASKLKGEHNFMMYLVGRSFTHIDNFVTHFSTELKNYKFVSQIIRIRKGMGFFPIRNELIEKFEIAEAYKNLLLGLNGKGRARIEDMSKGTDTNRVGLIYAFERLRNTDILSRISYYEEKPALKKTLLINIDVLNMTKFYKGQKEWYLSLVKRYEYRHNEIDFMCDISNPLGLFIIATFENQEEADKFIKNAKDMLKEGANIKYHLVEEVLLGKLGIRNMDMKFTHVYGELEYHKIVPKVSKVHMGEYQHTLPRFAEDVVKEFE
jgi:DNA-binding Lrp family transcriptional regulator